MKYRLAYALACTETWVDDKVFGHADRWFPMWMRVPYPLCNWSADLHEWAAERCCADGCLRCDWSLN